RVVIDRPERRNARTIGMYHGLKKSAVLAERDPAIDVLLVTAAGDHFCVGGEMGGRHEGSAGLDRETDGIDLLPFVQFERCPKIVVLGINGTCQGGGLNLTLTADLAVASERATFRAPELLRGVADCFLGARLATRVGMARAKLLLFTAAEVTAAEALAMGLVGRVVPHPELAAALGETIERVRQTGPPARAALERGLGPIVVTVAVPCQDGLGPARGHATLDPLTAHLARHPHLARLLQRALLEESPAVHALLERWIGSLYREGIAVVRKAARDA